jgi:gamma-glutamylcysteine synthetase
MIRLKQILKPDGQLMLVDSAWSDMRSRYRKKEGMQERVLNDGRKFSVYKRYFDRADIMIIFERYRFRLKSYYIGDVILAVGGEIAHECTGL